MLIASLAFFVLGPAVTVQEAVTQAAEETAREVSKKIGTQTTNNIATEVVNEVLSVHGLSVGSSSGVLVIVQENNLVTTIGDTQLSTSYPSPAPMAFANPNEVIATVYVDVDAAPIPNVLSYWQFDISGRVLTRRAAAYRDP
ncbi:hypothetical protein GC197_01315 [bacterium]|nr:hypothetical protein [bacterium]